MRLPRSISEELAADLVGRPRDLEALVFTAPLGGPLRPHTWVKSFFKPAVRVAGLPEGLRLLFPSEMEAVADRLDQARTAALANRERTPRGPAVVNLSEAAGR